MYASLDAIYVGSTNWGFYWWWRGDEEPPSIQTHIHKFAFDKDGKKVEIYFDPTDGRIVKQR